MRSKLLLGSLILATYLPAMAPRLAIAADFMTTVSSGPKIDFCTFDLVASPCPCIDGACPGGACPGGVCPPSGKFVIPESPRDWSYSGDDGTAESIRLHLLGSNHRDAVMRWLGIGSISEYRSELDKLTYSELKELHSVDHEGLTTGSQAIRPNSGTEFKVVSSSGREAPCTPPVAIEATKAVLYQKPVVRTRTGFLGRQIRYYDYGRSGCPGGVCPTR